MKDFLKKIWYVYESEHPEETNAERRNVIKQLAKTSECFLKELTQEQKEIFAKIADLEADVASLNAVESFEVGVKFATEFLLAALIE